MSQEKFYGFEFVKESGGIKEYTMTSNGLTVLIKEDKTAPVATFMVTYRVGSVNEATGHTGANKCINSVFTETFSSVFWWQTKQNPKKNKNCLKQNQQKQYNKPRLAHFISLNIENLFILSGCIN